MTDDTRTTGGGEPDDEALADLFRWYRSDTSTGPSCPPVDLVQAAQMGTLPAAVQDRVVVHVAHCVVCQALAEALEDPSIADPSLVERDRILMRIRSELRRPERVGSRNRVRLAAAAVAALAIGGSVVIWQARRAPQQIGQDLPQPGAPSVFHLEKAPVGSGGGTDVLWRGSVDSDAVQGLNRALESYRADDYAQAARRLQTLVQRHPQSGSVHFYLGVSNLFLAADAEAITALETTERLATGDPNLSAEAAWYLALAYHRTGQNERAAGKLDALCRGASSRATRGCAALTELSRRSSAPRSR